MAARLRTETSPFPLRGSWPNAGTVDIGNRKELFIDAMLIDETARISKYIPRPEKYIENPVLRPDRSWEPVQGQPNSYGIGVAGQCVLYDPEEKIFKMWYLGSGPV